MDVETELQVQEAYGVGGGKKPVNGNKGRK